ncbi:hypothetical protein ACF0H5_020630 [Mactra antiquata]
MNVTDKNRHSCLCADASNDLKPSSRHSRNVGENIKNDNRYVQQCDNTYTCNLSHNIYSFHQEYSLNESVPNNSMPPVYNNADIYISDQHILWDRNDYIPHTQVSNFARVTLDGQIQNVHENVSTRGNHIHVPISGNQLCALQNPDDKENHNQYRRSSLNCDLKPSYRRSGELCSRKENLPTQVNQDESVLSTHVIDDGPLYGRNSVKTCVKYTAPEYNNDIKIQEQCRNKRVSLPLEDPLYIVSPLPVCEQTTLPFEGPHTDSVSPPPESAEQITSEPSYRKHSVPFTSVSVEQGTSEPSYRKHSVPFTSVSVELVTSEPSYGKVNGNAENDLQVSERRSHKLSEKNLVSNKDCDSKNCDRKIKDCGRKIKDSNRKIKDSVKPSISDCTEVYCNKKLHKVQDICENQLKKNVIKCLYRDKNFGEKFHKQKSKRSIDSKQDCIDKKSKISSWNSELNTPNKKLHRIQNIHKKLAKSEELTLSKEGKNRSGKELLSKLDDIFPLVSVNQDSNRPVRSSCIKDNNVLDRKIQSSGIWNSVNSTY